MKSSGAALVNEDVKSLVPDENKVVTASGKELKYDYLVVAAGMKTDWGAMPGLRENLGKSGVVSNYEGACRSEQPHVPGTFAANTEHDIGQLHPY